MDNLNHEICELLKKQLKRAGTSYKDLARLLNISEVSIKRLLNQQQPLSISRLIDISGVIEVPLSELISQAEKKIASIPVFSKQQDMAFCEHPELYNIFMKIINERADTKVLKNHFELDEASLYLYLRELEKIGLIIITFELNFRLAVPRHIHFTDKANFPMHFKNQIIDGLKQRIQLIEPDDQNAFLITAKLRLTEEEFHEYNLKLEELMLDALKLSQTRDAFTLNTYEYTILDMGAEGSYYPELKKPERLKR